jgi:phosphodiesterase/alkaline phosphatase D-like protein
VRGFDSNRLLLPLAIMVMAGGALFPTSSAAQNGYQAKIIPPAKPAARVLISEGPALESVKDNTAIIRWTSNNPGGSDEHFGVVHYGTDPDHLSQMSKSHIRLNQNHSDTIFRVRVDGLLPQTTYYYTVDSMQATGKSDGVNSSVHQFANP